MLVPRVQMSVQPVNVTGMFQPECFNRLMERVCFIIQSRLGVVSLALHLILARKPSNWVCSSCCKSD